MKNITVIIYFLLSFLVELQAAPLCRIQRYDENDGLTQWHVTQMTQDRQGMMWFSTWNGLCRYDGYEFRGFKGRVGDGSLLATDRIRSVWMCGDGNLGCRVDDDQFLFNFGKYSFETRRGMPSRGKNATAVKENRPFHHYDGKGNLWTVYYDGRLTYTPRGGKEMTFGEKLESARFCMADRQGNLWVAGTSGIYKISFPVQNGVVALSEQGAETKAFFVDNRKRYWIATKEDNTVVIYGKDNRRIGYLAPDGRIVKGYVMFRCPVYCLMQTADGTVWLGSKPGGLFRLTERGNGEYKIDRIGGLVCNDVYDIKEDRWGRLWVATLGGGICCIPNPKAKNPVVAKPFTEITGYPVKLARKVRMIHLTKSGVLLAAATDGLLVAKLEKDLRRMAFHCHTREAKRGDALSCSAVMNIAEDCRGRLFVSTESGGVNMITSRRLTDKKLSFRHFDEHNGMATDVALSVVGYGKQMLVVGSNCLMVFSPDSDDHISFGRQFFQYDCRFSEAIPTVLPDGRWAFGLQNGVYYVYPHQLRKSGYVPQIALTGINIQGVPGSCSVNAADTLVLSSNERSMTLSFSAVDYSPDSRISYAFALVKDGDRVKWNYIGYDHSATLLDLEPGAYTMMIRSTNADGTWVNNVRRLTVIVTPSFWETTAARVLLVILVLAFAGLMAYTIIYVRRIKRQRREVLEAYLSLLDTGKAKLTDGQGTAPQSLRPELADEDDALMRRVSAFVEENIGNSDVGVGDMAAAAAMSRSGLQHKMKQIMGVTPLDFLREARMKQACRLLSTTDKPVAEVAYLCGYSDPKYFSRSFKASKGKSPKEWRDGERE